MMYDRSDALCRGRAMRLLTVFRADSEPV